MVKLFATLCLISVGLPAQTATIRVDIAARPINSFDPDNITGYTAPYWGARMINLEWVQHRSGVHRMFPSMTGIEDVTSYAVHRPDGNWSLMLVNRNETSPHTIQVAFADAKGKRSFTGPVTMVTFGSEQYVWKPDGAKSYADPDGPPVASVVPGSAQATFTLPQASITVLRGVIEEASR